ncbi:MAG: hypothetical protein COV31_02145 [Candidatus Yanofskybacteria bacterium CG10_big_fil_rev_8_21_14_0_10_46_23]|uniref:RNase H type-1 domain-containing protein n=1 Tax=Candidatus Yanofskybacteria bacterium CG10_big_fil_rev_8_21_14_0_10_46_23 TaxID=1975098 RepID=A0A2H0R3U7_9BACT|nr:MAG: hypothetical protein COV31_02145 [Candidatus Yanofskybacteria bacterium CG10_big_fil_rev_8_21_14_0_10_46_23]
MKKIKVFTDGGSRGNPGPAAIGVVIELDGETKKYGQFIGQATNNEAEYGALIFALKKTKLLVGKETAKKSEVEVFVDSELLARQINGQYKVKDKEMQELFMELWNLQMDFGKVIVKNVPREQNKQADKLANQALDQELHGKLDI